jgi:hypothetical protein
MCVPGGNSRTITLSLGRLRRSVVLVEKSTEHRFVGARLLGNNRDCGNGSLSDIKNRRDGMAATCYSHGNLDRNKSWQSVGWIEPRFPRYSSWNGKSE